MPKIQIQIDGEAYEIEAGETLFAVEDDPRLRLVFGCHSGRCGICRVRVLQGAENLSPRNEMEEMVLSIDDEPHTRLACQCEVRGFVSLRSEEG
jgi:ferredoxin